MSSFVVEARENSLEWLEIGRVMCYMKAMVKELIRGSSLEASLEEARQFGASSEDARRIHEIVEANLSPIVRGFDLKFDMDSTNKPGVWVSLFVEEDLRPPQKKISEWSSASRKVKNALLDERSSFEPYPYVSVSGRP